jgi:hypothetical protein
MNPNRRSSFGARRALASLLVIALSTSGSVGCALFRDPVPPGFQRISLTAQVERDKQGKLEGDLVAYSTLKGVLVGTAIGAPSLAITAGGTTFGLSLYFCLFTIGTGPFAVFAYPACVLGATFIALIAGFAVGALGGGVYGGVTGLPSETAKQVTAVLARLEQDRSFQNDMLTAAQAAIPQQKQVGAADAEAVVTARLDELELRQHTKDRISLRLFASMVQAWQAEGKSKKNTCKYRYDSERKQADAWLADGGVAFGQAATQAIQTVARWMNRDLEAFATQTELPKSETDPRSCFRAHHWYSFLLPY